MKAQIAILLSGFAISAWGQGSVSFRNLGEFPTVADRNVYREYVGGTRLVGTNYVAGLWFVPGTNPAAVDGRISPELGRRSGTDCRFRAPTTTAPGTWMGLTFVLDGVNVGEAATLQVRVWDKEKFATFAEAFASGEFGASEPFSYTVPPPASPPAALMMDNLRAFSLTVDGNAVYIDDLAVAEGSNGVVQANFTLALDRAQTDPISVDYATADGTAVAGSDYVATSGTVTFAPGEMTKVVSVTVTADAAPEDEETFYLRLSNPVNGHLGRTQAACTITEVRIVGVSVDTTVSFNTVAHRRYVVERTVNIVDWEAVVGATNVLGTGGVVSIVDRGSGCDGMRAYRARLLTD